MFDTRFDEQSLYKSSHWSKELIKYWIPESENE